MSKGSRTVSAQKHLVKEQPSDVLILENPNLCVSKSITFLKQLTTVAVSSVAFLRGLFPPEAFVEKKMAGQLIHVIKGVDEIPTTRTLITWMKEAFQLVHSYHLKKMVFIIQTKEGVALEVYTFSYSYNQEEIQCDIMGEVDGKVVLEQSQESGVPEDISKSVCQLIRCILAHSTTLPSLPHDSLVAVKLFLDEETPEDLIPECYRFNGNEEVNFPSEAETLKLGKVETKFSTFSVSSKTLINRENEMSGEGIQQDYIELIDDDEDPIDVDEIPSSQPDDNFQMPSLASSTSQFYLSGDKAKENDSNTTNLSEKLSVASLRDKVVACICECSELFDETIICALCNTYQHKTCYKMLESHKVETHVCVKCHNPGEGKVCSVPELLNDDNQKESALFRQALMYCRNSSQVSCKRLMIHLKVPRQLADVIFKRLDTEGCLEPATNRGLVRNVKPDLQENLEKRFFSEPPAVKMPMEVPESPATLSLVGNERFKRQRCEEVPESPVTLSLEGNERFKRQRCEENNSFHGMFSPPQKQPKILSSTLKTKKYCA